MAHFNFFKIYKLFPSARFYGRTIIILHIIPTSRNTLIYNKYLIHNIIYIGIIHAHTHTHNTQYYIQCIYIYIYYNVSIIIRTTNKIVYMYTVCRDYQ